MRLILDTRKGLAGDICAAGLIGLGAPANKVCGAMEAAGRCLGKVSVSHAVAGGVHRLNISVPMRPDHLHASEARSILLATLAGSGILNPWSDMGMRALEALIEAETHVHASHPALSPHFHGHEPVLHEAADIVIDIMGLAAGMMALGIDDVAYLDFVNVGSGKVRFSHGELDVPTPATRRILESHGFRWALSNAGMECATPTGAAILAGCRASRVLAVPEGATKALASGTRDLPPVEFLLHEKT